MTALPGASTTGTATRIKICCISDPGEAALAVRHGASLLGLVSEMPSGPGVISEEEIARIAATVPPGVGSILLTSKTDPSAIVAQQQRCGVSALQLCDRLPAGGHAYLHAHLPGIAIVQVVHVTGREAIDEALAAAPDVDGLLLDTGSRSATLVELGGTGRVHDWQISREIVERAGRPVYLAGGLNPGNVAQAIEIVRPFGVDICNGVRTDGRLDERKLAAFVAAVRGG